MMRELGSAKRLPLAPAASRKAPMLAAIPMQSVDTSGLMNCIVSKIDRPALTEPPGELMYSEMSLSGFFALQEQQLRHHQVAGVIVDRPDEEDDALAQQARVMSSARSPSARPCLDDMGHHAQTVSPARS
jgi:hypothetical protein